MDGSIGSQTASFYESFGNNPDNYGRLLHSFEEVEANVKAGYQEGFQITSHAIGTKGIDCILSAFDKILHDNNDLNNCFRNRIDHFEFPLMEQVDKAVDELHLLFTAQPGYSWVDENFQQAYRKYLRPEQFDRQIPLKTMVEKGAIICGSSDSPVQTINPFIQIHGMVNFPISHEQLTVYQAFRTYTFNGAYSTFEENERGTLAVGKFADFIIMHDDPFQISPEKIIELTVDASFMRGIPAPKLKQSTGQFLIKGFVGKKQKI
jgi:predicted amidohydrolase YtcJ